MGQGEETLPHLIMRLLTKISVGLIISGITLIIVSKVLSDELQIPYSCWPIELQEEFAKSGRKLDLIEAERTEDSWGYVLNKGHKFVIYTYRSATQEDFTVIKDIVFKIELEKSK